MGRVRAGGPRQELVYDGRSARTVLCSLYILILHPLYLKWQHLAWADAAPGLDALRTKFTVVSLTNGSTRTLIDAVSVHFIRLISQTRV